MIRILVLCPIVFLMTAQVRIAWAHDDFIGKMSPTGLPCCGGNDCATFDIRGSGVSFTAEAEGYRIVLTESAARLINPYRIGPVDALVPWSEAQDSWDGRFRLCIPTYKRPANDFYCFWAPPGT